jgi:TonB family protein
VFAAYASIAGAQSAVTQSVRQRIYQIGGEVSAPEPIARTAPAYSDELRNARTRGAVVLVFVIDPSGTPRNIRISHGLSQGADKAAAHAPNSWRFAPAQRRGEPVAVKATAEMQFGPWLDKKERRSAPIPVEGTMARIGAQVFRAPFTLGFFTVRNVIEYLNSQVGGIMCCHFVRTSPVSR